MSLSEACITLRASWQYGAVPYASLDSRDGIVILLTSDEEIGSPTSRQLIEAQPGEPAPR
jgi:hypothetical protein